MMNANLFRIFSCHIAEVLKSRMETLRTSDSEAVFQTLSRFQVILLIGYPPRWQVESRCLEFGGFHTISPAVIVQFWTCSIQA